MALTARLAEHGRECLQISKSLWRLRNRPRTHCRQHFDQHIEQLEAATPANCRGNSLEETEQTPKRTLHKAFHLRCKFRPDTFVPHRPERRTKYASQNYGSPGGGAK